jgi:hypothetical protein
VGDDSWGWTAWAHNLCAGELEPIVSKENIRDNIVDAVNDLDNKYPSLPHGSVESIMDKLVRVQADGKPGLGDYLDGKALFTAINSKVRSSLKDGNRGTYIALHFASTLTNKGSRVSFEQSFSPPVLADIVDHTQQRIYQMKAVLNDNILTPGSSSTNALEQLNKNAKPYKNLEARIVLINPGHPMNEMDRSAILLQLRKQIVKSDFGSIRYEPIIVIQKTTGVEFRFERSEFNDVKDDNP